MRKYRLIILLVALAAAVLASGYVPQPVKAESLTFASGGYTTACALILGIFAISMILSFTSGRLTASPWAKVLLWMGLLALIFFGVAFLIIKVTAGLISWLWGIGAPVIVVGLSIWAYFHFRRKAGEKVSSNSVRKSAAGSGQIKFDFRVLYSSMSLLLAIGIIALVVGAPTHYLVVPLAFAVLAIALWKVAKWRGFMLIGAVTIVLYIAKYCIPEYISFASDKFWPSLALTLLYMGLILPLSDLYCRKETLI